jgi:glyoxylase-like metal-dependent hydrolase (beta-lactamase superfamily II)
MYYKIWTRKGTNLLMDNNLKLQDLSQMNISESYRCNLRKLTEDIYYLPAWEKTDRPVLAVVVGKERSLVVDSGNSDKHAELFLKALSENNISKPDYLAITHWHWDHVFGIKTMGIPTFAHVGTQKKVDKMVRLDWTDEALDERVANGLEVYFCSEKIKVEIPVRDYLELAAPNINFMEKIEVDLGDIHCIIEHVGGDHSIDSTIIYIPERKVLFLGDCLCPDLYNGECSYSVEKAVPLIKKLQSYDADYYIESHSEPVNKKEMTMSFNFIEYICNLVNKYNQDLQEIIRECEIAFQRKLNEDELNIINLFIVGLLKK